MEIKIRRKDLDNNGIYKLKNCVTHFIELVDKKDLVRIIEFDSEIDYINLRYSCNNLEQIIFNEGLFKIGGYIKYTNVKELVFPSTLKCIEENTFNLMTNLNSITFNSWPKIEIYNFDRCKNVNNININYNEKSLYINIDKKYILSYLYSDEKTKNIIVECNSNNERLIITIDKYLNKKETLILKSISNDNVKNEYLLFDTKYDDFKIISKNIDVIIKAFDFSNFHNKPINFKLDTYFVNTDKIILPEISESNIDIQLNHYVDINKIAIKNNSINHLENNEFYFMIDSPYSVYAITQINGYYVFNLKNRNQLANHSIIVDKQNNVINTHNLIVNDEFSLNIAINKYNDLNRNKISHILSKYNLSSEALKDILEMVVESLFETEKENINDSKNQQKLSKKLN